MENTEIKNIKIDSPLAVVIVLNWNGEEVIRGCLESLRKQTFKDFVTVVVDNNSSDNSPEIISEEFPETELFKLEENFGFAKGNNLGVEHVWEKFPDVKYIALLNNDTSAQPEWLEKLVESLENNEKCGAAAAKLLCWDGKTKAEVIDSAGDIFFKHGLAGKRGFGEVSENYSTTEPIFGACAGAAIYRSKMLQEIGLLDEDFFCYNEDVDLCFRIRLAGWNIIFVYDAEVWHRVSYSAKPFSDRVIYWSKRNSFWVLIKNLPLKLFFRYFFSIICYNILSDVRWLLGGRFKPVLKGRWDAILGLRKMLLKRKKIQATRKISSKELDSWIIRETPWFVSLRRNFWKIANFKKQKTNK